MHTQTLTAKTKIFNRKKLLKNVFVKKKKQQKKKKTFDEMILN